MGYRERAKSRKLRAKILACVNVFKFKLTISSLEGRIILGGSIFSIISLFFTWVEGKGFSYNAFSGLVGNVGYIIILLSAVLMFLVLSTKNKEKVKLNMSISFRDYFLVNTFSFFIILLCFVSASFIRGLYFFSKEVFIGKGPVFCIIGALFSMLGGYLLYKQYKNDLGNMLLDNSSEIEQNNPDKKNMQLPF